MKTTKIHVGEIKFEKFIELMREMSKMLECEKSWAHNETMLREHREGLYDENSEYYRCFNEHYIFSKMADYERYVLDYSSQFKFVDDDNSRTIFDISIELVDYLEEEVSVKLTLRNYDGWTSSVYDEEKRVVTCVANLAKKYKNRGCSYIALDREIVENYSWC